MEVDIIIRCFTELLFEEKILIVMENTEDLLPVCMALHSLIYPLKYCIVVPFLASDNKETAISNLQLVSQPFKYLIGISGQDADRVFKIIKRDEFKSPLIIDLR